MEETGWKFVLTGIAAIIFFGMWGIKRWADGGGVDRLLESCMGDMKGGCKRCP